MADTIFLECTEAAQNTCHGYRQQYIGRQVNYTWGSLHFLLLAGLTYLHCLWTSPKVRLVTRQDDVSKTCTACTMVLVFIPERWEEAATYRDIFAVLAERTMTMVVNWKAEQYGLPLSTPAPSEDPKEYSIDRSVGVEQGEMDQWIADMDSEGIMRGVEDLLCGWVNIQWYKNHSTIWTRLLLTKYGSRGHTLEVESLICSPLLLEA